MIHHGVGFRALVLERVYLRRHVAKVLQEGLVHGVLHPSEG